MDFFERFFSTVEESPDMICHESHYFSLTYKEVFDIALTIKELVEVKTNNLNPIIVYGHKDEYTLGSFLGITMSKRAYIPLDSSLPLDRIQSVIDLAGIHTLINLSNKNLDSLENILILTKDDIFDIHQSHSLSELSSFTPMSEDDIFYIIYTSGSTGTPKGVPITYKNIMSYLKWMEGFVLEIPHKRFLNVAPYSFDLSVGDTFVGLYTGGSIFSLTKDKLVNLGDIFSFLKEKEINIWNSTPSFLNMCMVSEEFDSSLLPHLKLFMFCGEIFSKNSARQLRKRFKDSDVINFYGPTEATVAVTAIKITDDIINLYEDLPIGYVKDDCDILLIYTANEHPSQAEFIIVGDSVADGYYKNPGMSEKIFYRHNLDGKETNAYVSGDIGYKVNGMYFYIKRKDSQLKVNGFRVEIGDIEINLKKLPMVSMASVFKDNNESSEWLTAVVVLSNDVSDEGIKTVMSIKNALKEHLPEYMLPRKILIRDSIPLNANGKVDRNGLKERDS